MKTRPRWGIRWPGVSLAIIGILALFPNQVLEWTFRQNVGTVLFVLVMLVAWVVLTVGGTAR
jgi:hypothetical protein